MQDPRATRGGSIRNVVSDMNESVGSSMFTRIWRIDNDWR